MSQSKTENAKKCRLPIIWLWLVLLVIGALFGGVSAYLSMSSQPVSDNFSEAKYPTVTVNGSSVTVDPCGYSVYLRIAVDACWKSSSSVLPEEPTGVEVSAEFKPIDNFYYYSKIIDKVTTLSPVVSYTETTKDGYNLTVNVAAQVVQAVGMTDDGTKTAVEAAWGVTPQQITGN